MMMKNNYDDTKIVKSRMSEFSRGQLEAGRYIGTSWAYVQLDMSPKVVAVSFQGRRSHRVRSRFVCRSLEISLVPSLHRASTDTLIGMMKVTEHYTHSFEKLHSVSIRAHFWSDKLVCHKEQESYYPLMSYSKTLVFKILLPLVVVRSVSTSVTQKPDMEMKLTKIGIHDPVCKNVLICLETNLFTWKH